MALAFLLRSLLALSLAGTLPAFAADVLPFTPAQKQNLGIVSEAAVTQAAGPALTYPARVVTAPAGVRVVAAAGEALVTQLYVQAGDGVKRGAPLVTLSMPGLADAHNTLTQARLRAQLATDNAARDEKLFAEGLIAESRLRATRTEVQAARAGRAAAQQALAWLGQGKVSGSAITLVSPIAGVVSETAAEPGLRVDAGMALMKLVDPSQLALEIPLSTAQAQQVEVGQRVTLAEHEAGGRVIALLPQLNAAQSVLVRASLTDPQRLLRPGQSVQAALMGTPAAQGVVVPAAALVWKGTAPHVFVETANGFTPTPVTLLRRNAEQAEVSGLASGARVAVRGVAALKARWLGE
jgi:RND family efflux transporter MFP subunit